MKTHRPRGDNGPSQFEEDAKPQIDPAIGREYWVAVNRAGMLRGPLFVNADMCAETTCPGNGLVYKVRVVGKRKYPAKACMKVD